MALRPGAGSGTYRVSVAYDVAVQRHVETKVTLHSGIQVIERQPCISRLSLGAAPIDYDAYQLPWTTSHGTWRSLYTHDPVRLASVYIFNDFSGDVLVLLQILNSTMLSLNIGEQSSGKKAMTVLATIAPGEAFSMPVLRKEPGLICVQPAGVFPISPNPCTFPDPGTMQKIRGPDSFGCSLPSKPEGALAVCLLRKDCRASQLGQ